VKLPALLSTALPILAAAILAIPSAARADDSAQGHCHCDSYQYLVPFSIMGSQVSDISLAMLHADQSPFAFTEAERQALREEINSNSLIPAECKQYLISKNLVRLTFVASGSLGGTGAASGEAFNETSAGVSPLLGGYEQLVQAAIAGACGTLKSKASHEAIEKYSSCLKTKGMAAMQAFQAQFAKLTPAQILAQNPKTFAGLTRQQIAVLQQYNTVVATQDYGVAGDYLTGVRKTDNTTQKLLLGQLLLSFMQTPGYDHARDNAGLSGKGVVTGTQLLETAEENTFAQGVNYRFVQSLIKYAGVCRDDHTLVALIEQKLGIPHSMTTSYAQLGGDYHVTYVGQDPNDPMSVHQIDWFRRTDRAGGDSRSLFQGPSDIATGYRLATPGGLMAADVQSQAGMTLAGMLGFSPDDPLARNYGRMAAGEASLGQNGTTNLTFGMASDGTGANYQFVGVTQSWGANNPHFSGRAGLALGTSQRGGTSFDAPGDTTTFTTPVQGQLPGKMPTFDLDFLYTQLEEKYRTNKIKITPELTARFESAASLYAMVARVREGGQAEQFPVNPGAISGQGDLHLTHQVVVDQGNPGDATRATYKAGVIWSPGIADVKNNYWAQVPVPILDAIFASADLRRQLGRTRDGQAMLVAAAQLVFSEISARGRAELGIASDHFTCVAGAEGRLTNSSATYEDSSARQAYFTCSWAPTKKMRLSTTLFVPLEANTPQGIGASGSAFMRF
jgi:hypothetical protein